MRSRMVFPTISSLLRTRSTHTAPPSNKSTPPVPPASLSKGKTYDDAVAALNSLQSNAATLEALRASGGRMSEFAIPEMIEYLERIGHKPEDLNKLNVIHVTGTKGKGSTSAFCDSILRKTVPDWKVGLYTSPHLVSVRERIRINGEPIPEEDFVKYFFEVWDRLEQNPTRKLPSTSLMPAYFRMMTLVAFHYFLSIKVDATILEVGVGGYYDSTNIVPKPIVTGVTSLGLDHTAVLGNTLKDIAWQKGGIYKKGVPALSVEQPEEGLNMLKEQAKTLKASSFTVVPSIPDLSALRLGLSGAHQVQNATLAVNLTHQFLLNLQKDVPGDYLPSLYPTPLAPAVVAGLESARWPGRCQEVNDPNHKHVTWFLDGSHTIESIKACTDWYFHPSVGLKPTASEKTRQRVLIFNSTGGRSGSKFLEVILDGMRAGLSKYGSDGPAEGQEAKFFDHVIFCTNITYADGQWKGDLANKTIDMNDVSALKTQQGLSEGWQALVPSFPKENNHILPSIQHAINIIHDLPSGGQLDILVIGSLHLVGGVIEVANIGSEALAT